MGNMYRSRLDASGGVQPTGNAQPADVLSGKTFSNAEGIDKTGTMVNNGAVSGTATPSQPYTISAGYHNGSGTVTASEVGTEMLEVTGASITNITSENAYLVLGRGDTTQDNVSKNGTSVPVAGGGGYGSWAMRVYNLGKLVSSDQITFTAANVQYLFY